MSDDCGIASHGARGESVLGRSAYRFGGVQSRVPTGAGELMPPLLSCEQWPGNAAAATPIRGCFRAPALARNPARNKVDQKHSRSPVESASKRNWPWKPMIEFLAWWRNAIPKGPQAASLLLTTAATHGQSFCTGRSCVVGEAELTLGGNDALEPMGLKNCVGGRW